MKMRVSTDLLLYSDGENLVKVVIDECDKLCENKYIWCREKEFVAGDKSTSHRADSSVLKNNAELSVFVRKK